MAVVLEYSLLRTHGPLHRKKSDATAAPEARIGGPDDTFLSNAEHSTHKVAVSFLKSRRWGSGLAAGLKGIYHQALGAQVSAGARVEDMAEPVGGRWSGTVRFFIRLGGSL